MNMRETADKIVKRQLRLLLKDLLESELYEFHFDQAVDRMADAVNTDNDDIWDAAQLELGLAFKRAMKTIQK